MVLPGHLLFEESFRVQETKAGVAFYVFVISLNLSKTKTLSFSFCISPTKPYTVLGTERIESHNSLMMRRCSFRKMLQTSDIIYLYPRRHFFKILSKRMDCLSSP